MRRRLAVAIVGVTAGAIVLFAIPLAVSLRKVYREEEMIRLERDTVAATRGIDVGLGSSADPLEVPRSPDRRVVYDRTGAVLAGAAGASDRPLALNAVRSGRPVVRDEGAHMTAAVPLLDNERVTGVLVASRADSAAAADTHQAWLLLAALAAGVMAAAVGAALLVARGLARPLERLAASARRLGLGDFSVRAPRAQVAEVDAVAEALDASADRIGEMVRREQTFSADASHQLRTPLTALRIQLEEAELGGVAADPGPALSQVERLEQTIETLLAAARGSRRGIAESDLVAIAEELESEWRPLLAERGRRLRLQVDGDHLRAAADPGVVREILHVLVENAAAHGEGIVTVRIRHANGWMRAEVQDEGPGFGDNAAAAFERAGVGGGHGIGLSLARSLANAEGGELAIVSPGPEPVLALLLKVVGPDP